MSLLYLFSFISQIVISLLKRTKGCPTKRNMILLKLSFNSDTEILKWFVCLSNFLRMWYNTHYTAPPIVSCLLVFKPTNSQLERSRHCSSKFYSPCYVIQHKYSLGLEFLFPFWQWEKGQYHHGVFSSVQSTILIFHNFVQNLAILDIVYFSRNRFRDMRNSATTLVEL